MALLSPFVVGSAALAMDEGSSALVSSTIEFGKDAVRSASFSPNGRFLALGIHQAAKDKSPDKFSSALAIWSLESGQVIKNTVLDNGVGSHEYWSVEPQFLQYTSDGNRLVFIERGAIRIYDSTSLKEQFRIELELGSTRSPGQTNPFAVDMIAAPVGNEVAVLITYLPNARSGKLRLYDLDSKIMTWERSFDEDVNGYSLAFSPDATKIAVAMPQARKGLTLTVVDVKSDRSVFHLADRNDPIAHAAFAKDGELLTVSQWKSRQMKRGLIKFWNIKDGKVSDQITAPPAGVHSYVAVSKNQQYVLGYIGQEKTVEYFSKSVDQRFRIWSLPSKEIAATSPDLLRSSDVSQPTLLLSPDGGMVLVYWPHTDGAARLYKVVNKEAR
jgi:WD40 repeat protein